VVLVDDVEVGEVRGVDAEEEVVETGRPFVIAAFKL
jgi:hypothetical protein